MCSYRWIVYGICCTDEKHFIGECISNDIIKAIRLFREHELVYSPHKILRAEQVRAGERERILSIKICTE